jgi:hypothetical protein
MVLFFWDAIFDERAGLSFVYAAGPRQCSLSRVRVPWISRPYFYCLSFDISNFVASYDSQGHGGGIRPPLHTGNSFLICIVGGGVQTGSTRHVGHLLAYCTCPGDCEDGEFGGMNGRGNRSTGRKPAPAPLCPLQIPLDQTRDWTRAAAVGSQRLTASAMARP